MFKLYCMFYTLVRVTCSCIVKSMMSLTQERIHTRAFNNNIDYFVRFESTLRIAACVYTSKHRSNTHSYNDVYTNIIPYPALYCLRRVGRTLPLLRRFALPWLCSVALARDNSMREKHTYICIHTQKPTHRPNKHPLLFLPRSWRVTQNISASARFISPLARWQVGCPAAYFSRRRPSQKKNNIVCFCDQTHVYSSGSRALTRLRNSSCA